MKRNIRKIALLLFSVIALSGCANTNSVSEHEEDGKNADKKAQYWAERVNEIEGVEMAVVVLNDDRALVEIEVLGELNDETLIPLKDKIEKMILDEDETIEHVGVTVAPEIISRMAGEKTTDFSEVDNGLDDEGDREIMGVMPVV